MSNYDAYTAGKNSQSYPVDTFNRRSYPPVSNALYSPDLTPVSNNPCTPIVANFINDPIQQVFFNQAYQHKLTLEHLDQMIDQRVNLHEKHLDEIRHRHMQFQEALSIARILKLPDNHRRETNLEKVLMDLEKNKRDEELSLWKDTLELRTKAMEESRQYEAIRQRVELLTGGPYD